jgi:hypothetical protein
LNKEVDDRVCRLAYSRDHKRGHTLEDNLSSRGPLLQRVDRRSNLLVGCEPEQHGSVYTVKVGDEHRWGQDEEKHWDVS